MNTQVSGSPTSVDPVASTAQQLLHLEDLRISFPSPDGNGRVQILHGVSFGLQSGKALALVGESGSGKTMTARALIGLLPPTARIESGAMVLDGKDLTRLNRRQWLAVRGGSIGTVFQDAMSGLDPVRTIGSLLVESIRLHTTLSKRAARAQAVEVLGSVGISNPLERLKSYPHQLSGGQRQRVMIALAIVTKPPLVIADEPTTALDATIQAQILELLRTELGRSSLIIITHDLGVAASIADNTAVMYAGRIVEYGLTSDVLERPRHPYTVGLLDAAPAFSRERRPLRPIPGTPPRPQDLGDGCAFAPRCKNAQSDCLSRVPDITEVDGHQHACLHPIEERFR